MEVFGRCSWRLPSTLWYYTTKAPVLALLTEYEPSETDTPATSQPQVGIYHLFVGPFHTTPVKFENGVFTLKMHQKFSVCTTLETIKNVTICGHFGLVVTRMVP